MNKKTDGTIIATITGIISPQSESDIADIYGLMSDSSSAKKMAFNRIVKDGVDDRGAIERYIRQRIPTFNTRYARDAIIEAQAIILSQKELLPMYLQNTQKKLKKSVAKLVDYVTEDKKPKTDLLVALKGLCNRIGKLKSRITELQSHINNGTIPNIVFGGKNNFKKLQKGLISRKQWKDLRTNSFYSRGDASKQGNLHTRLYYNEAEDSFRIRLSIPQDKGRCKYIYCPVSIASAKRHKSRRETLISAVQNNASYSVRIIRRNSNIEAHITLDEVIYGSFVKKIPESVTTIAGIDLNTDRLAVTLSDYKGNFIRHKTFYCHDLEHCRTGQRDFTINHVVKEMFEWLTTNHTEVVVIERLDFKQDMDTNAWLNRFRSNFTYSKLHKAITRKALRTGMFIKTVNPTYTSQIGTLKYAAQYGMARHEAAAYVIARRGLGYNERIPKRIIQNLPDIISTLIQKASGAKEAAKKKLTAHIKVLKQWKAYSPVSTIHKWKLWSLLYQSLPCPVFPMEGIAGVSGQAAPLTGAGP